MEKKQIDPPKATVVIPMYNCEQFVQGVLSMFSQQSFRDFEVICVIDGATDGTEEEVKKYCKTDDRFRYVIRENGGAGAARNTGLDIAKGEYIVFSDADDEYSPDYLKKLYETAIKYDAQIAMCLFVEKNYILKTDHIQGFNVKNFRENTIYSHREIDDLFVSFHSRVPNKMYNLRFIRDNGIRFAETVIGNDTFFVHAGLAMADHILVLHDVLTTYRLFISRESLREKRVRFQVQALYSIRLLYQWLKEHSLLDIHGEDYMRRVNQVLMFEGGHKTSPGFISEFAHMLNAEEPWESMTSGEILSYLEEGILAKAATKNEQLLSNSINSKIVESDLQLSFFLDYYRNRVHTAQLLRKVSLERYGRDFDKEDSLPELFRR